MINILVSFITNLKPKTFENVDVRMKKVLVSGCVGSVKEKKISSSAASPLELSSVANAVKYPEVSGDFVVEDGVVFAGKHLLIDLWGASHLDDIDYIRNTLENIVNECNATLLHIHLHQFTENGGISGVALLAESHVSIHTWPERDYAALDVFMCGQVSPAAAVPVLRKAFQPTSLQVKNYKRGITG